MRVFFRTVKLLFANREEKDIIWRDKLDKLQEEVPERFVKVHLHVVISCIRFVS